MTDAERLFASTSAGRRAEIPRLVTNLGYLQYRIARDGMQDFLFTLKELRRRIEAGTPEHEIVSQVIDVLRGEAASFIDWKPYETGPAFGNQMSNAARRLGYPPGFWRGIDGAGTHHPAWLLRSWTAGPADDWVRRVLPMPGERRSYIWDSYGAGPAGCQTRVQIALDGRRLLTETTSFYTTGLSDSYNKTRQVWSLDDGTLLDHCDIYSHDGSAKDDPPLPSEFRDWATLPGIAATIPSDIASRVAQAGPADRVEVSLEAVSINSSEMLIRVHDADARCWVFETSTDRLYPTDASLRGLDVGGMARSKDGLVVVAVDRHQDVWLLRLDARRPAPPADDVRSLALDPSTGNLACLFAERVEVRSARSGAVLESKPLVEKSESAVLNSEHGCWSLRGGPIEAWPVRFTGAGWQYAAEAGALPAHHEQPQLPLASHYDSPGVETRTPSGRLLLSKRRCSIVVWEIPSGRWVASLGSGPTYGGGGNLNGLAVSSDDRYVISAPDGEGIHVWDLWDLQGQTKSRSPNWRLGGSEGIRKVAKLAFFWGDRLVAVATDDLMLRVYRFAQDSEVLAAVRLPMAPTRMLGEPHGAGVIVLDPTAAVTSYQYAPLPGPDVTSADGGSLAIRFAAPGVKRVEIAGTFTGWERWPLRREARGIWKETFSLGDGRHEYKLVVDGERWELDPHVPSCPGPFGPNNRLELPQDFLRTRD